MGTVSKPVQKRMERFRQKQMKLDELTKPGWYDASDYFGERDKMYGASQLKVLAVIQQHTDDDPPAPVPTTFGELMQPLEIILGISQILQGTSRPGSWHIRSGPVKLQSKTSIYVFEPERERNTTLLQ